MLKNYRAKQVLHIFHIELKFLWESKFQNKCPRVTELLVFAKAILTIFQSFLCNSIGFKI